MSCLLSISGPQINLQENDDPHPSLSDFHDYEPNLEFDDTELSQTDQGWYYFFFLN